MFLAPALPRCLPASARSLLPVPSFSAVCRRLVLTAGCLTALLAPSLARAQTPGEQDTSFVSILSGSTLFALTIQEINGSTRIFTAGDFDSDARLTTAGVYDTSFAIDPDFGNENGRIIYTAVQEVVLQDGNAPATNSPKVLIGGLFGRSTDQIKNNQPAQNILRLNLDGTLDTTFNPGKGSDNYITAILPLPDGGMVVGGLFELFNKETHEHIVRLDNSGAIVDNSVFSSSLDFDDPVLSLAAQVNPNAAGPQGQILVAGTFSNVNGKAHTSLARINADGTVDSSFSPTFSDRVRVVVCQPDGKILAGGDFETVNGVAVKHIVRLNYDGSVDTSFITQVTTMPPLVAAPVAVNVITPLGDGRYYIGGNFAEINGVNRRYLGRVLADGSVDSFDPGLSIINTVQQVGIDPLTNDVYVTETRSKSLNGDDKTYPPTLIRLFGGPPAVSLAATLPTAIEKVPGMQVQDGAFRINRIGGDESVNTTVYLSLSGTGTSRLGVDYTIPGLQPNGSGYTATIPAGKKGLKLLVIPTRVKITTPETITLTVQSDQSGTSAYSTSATGVTGTVTLINRAPQ